MLSELKDFFEKNDLAVKAASSIKNGREIALNVGETTYTFTKENGKNALKEGKPASPDLSFTMSEPAARELVSKKFDSVGQVGVYIFEKMLSSDPNQKIRAKLDVGFLNLMGGGYIGILTAGGTDVAKFLAGRGLGGLSGIKDAISKLRKGS